MTERLIQSKCDDSRLDAITHALLQQATQCVTTKGAFNLLLSDSEELDSVYSRLMYDPDLRAMPWGETHLWFLRNREESVVMHSGIPEENVHVNERIEQIDCSVITSTDVVDLTDELCNSCKAFLILTSSKLQINWPYSCVAHWFCS